MTSCRSPTDASSHASRAPSPSSGRGASSMGASRARRATQGSLSNCARQRPSERLRNISCGTKMPGLVRTSTPLPWERPSRSCECRSKHHERMPSVSACSGASPGMPGPHLDYWRGNLRRVLSAYVTYFNGSRPHQGINQRIPEPGDSCGQSSGVLAKSPPSLVSMASIIAIDGQHSREILVNNGCG